VQHDPNESNQPQPDSRHERVFSRHEAPKPWFLSIIETLRELSDLKRQPPLQISFRPMTEDDLLNSDDPTLRQLAELQRRKPLFQSLRENLKDLFHPAKLPPLVLTARPLSEEELQSLSMVALQKSALPWYRTFLGNARELFFPPKLPPLQVTSQPVKVKELFARDEYRGKSQFMSVAIHVGLVALAFLLGTNQNVQKAVKRTVTLVAPDISPFIPEMQVRKQPMGGGGGGGDRSPLPPSRGKLPRPDLKQFTPPMAVVHNEAPRLVMEPTIIADANTPLPSVNMPNYGDPFAKAGPPSNGTGSGGGIGTGKGGGVGPGDGGGYGPGKDGGFGGGAYRIGGGVSAPIPIFKVEPDYSEEARKAKYQGAVMLAIVVDESGKTVNVRVVRSLGMGLDEKAIEAVMKWRFRPGRRNGEAVPVTANVEVNFRLL